MHSGLCFALLGFAAFAAALPVKLVAISGAAYVMIATLKRFFPAIRGKWSIALNVAFSTTGMLMVARPGDLETPAFWAALLMTVAGAAGIHGTVKAAADGSSTPPPPKSAIRMLSEEPKPTRVLLDPTGNNPVVTTFVVPGRIRALAVVFALVLAIGPVGCMRSLSAGRAPVAPAALPTGAVDQADATAYKTLRPAHDFAQHISADVLAGRLKPSANQLRAIEAMNRALNVADQAEQKYHNAGGGSQAAMSTAIAAALQSWSEAEGALAQLN